MTFDEAKRLLNPRLGDLVDRVAKLDELFDS